MVSYLQKKLASLTQNKFNISTCDMGSPLPRDIICTPVPQQENMPQLKNYNGKGDPFIMLKYFKSFIVIMLMIIGF